MNKNQIVKRLAFDAAFAAITTVLYLFVKFPLPIFPSFLDVNFSMVPVIICAFMLGPWDAALCVLIRMVIKFMYGSGTMGVGELADLLIGAITCIPAGLLYHNTNLKHKTLFAFILVCVSWVLAGIFTNIFVNIPFYKNAFHLTDEALAGLIGDPIHLITFTLVDKGSINASNYMVYYIFLAIIPFNLMLALIVVGITAPLHKRLRILYDMIGSEKKVNIIDEENTNDEEISNDSVIAANESKEEVLTDNKTVKAA